MNLRSDFWLRLPTDAWRLAGASFSFGNADLQSELLKFGELPQEVWCNASPNRFVAVVRSDFLPHSCTH
jgi:hypothetical protein